MKKLFGILAVSAFLFASCGGNNTEAEAPVEQTEPVVEEAVVEEAPEAVADTTVAEATEAQEVAPEA
ncbi:MAG: hypothetical protein IJT04_01400 [Bacteroidales bacterium]|nr:hypothetical protein [Bacteroidales bacterium]